MLILQDTILRACINHAESPDSLHVKSTHSTIAEWVVAPYEKNELDNIWIELVYAKTNTIIRVFQEREIIISVRDAGIILVVLP